MVQFPVHSVENVPWKLNVLTATEVRAQLLLLQIADFAFKLHQVEHFISITVLIFTKYKHRCLFVISITAIFVSTLLLMVMLCFILNGFTNQSFWDACVTKIDDFTRTCILPGNGTPILGGNLLLVQLQNQPGNVLCHIEYFCWTFPITRPT